MLSMPNRTWRLAYQKVIAMAPRSNDRLSIEQMHPTADKKNQFSNTHAMIRCHFGRNDQITLCTEKSNPLKCYLNEKKENVGGIITAFTLDDHDESMASKLNTAEKERSQIWRS